MALRYWIVLFILGMAWGASFYFNEILLREIGPLSVGMFRVALGAIGCWIWIAVRRIPAAMPAGALTALVLFSAVQYAIPLSLFPVAQQGITSSAAGIINAATPIMVVIFSHFWPGGERATRLKSAGVAVGFLGILMLMLPSAKGQGENALWGLLLALVPTMCYACALNLIRQFGKVNRAVLTAWSLTFGAMLITPVALSVEGFPVVTQVETVIAAAIIGFVLTSAAFITLFWLIPIVGGTAASTLTFIAPISAVLLGVLLLGERLEVAHVVGMGIIFLGLLLIDGRAVRFFRQKTAGVP